LDIGILNTPEVEQPENLERIEYNPTMRKFQENLGFPWLWRLNACQWFWMSEYR